MGTSSIARRYRASSKPTSRDCRRNSWWSGGSKKNCPVKRLALNLDGHSNIDKTIFTAVHIIFLTSFKAACQCRIAFMTGAAVIALTRRNWVQACFQSAATRISPSTKLRIAIVTSYMSEKLLHNRCRCSIFVKALSSNPIAPMPLNKPNTRVKQSWSVKYNHSTRKVLLLYNRSSNTKIDFNFKPARSLSKNDSVLGQFRTYNPRVDQPKSGSCRIAHTPNDSAALSSVIGHTLLG